MCVRFALLALGMEAALVFFAYLGDLKQRMPEFWSVLFLAFCIYLIASRSVWRGRPMEGGMDTGSSAAVPPDVVADRAFAFGRSLPLSVGWQGCS